ESFRGRLDPEKSLQRRARRSVLFDSLEERRIRQAQRLGRLHAPPAQAPENEARVAALELVHRDGLAGHRERARRLGGAAARRLEVLELKLGAGLEDDGTLEHVA